MARFLLLSILGLACLNAVYGDLPLHCLRGDVIGKWRLNLGNQNGNKFIDCSDFETAKSMDIELAMPNKVVRNGNEVGTWTMVYDEAMEIRMDGHVYTSFFQFAKPDYETATMHRSFCGMTWRGQGGSFHDLTGGKWGCFHGAKTIDADAVTYVSHDGKKHWESCAESGASDCNMPYSADVEEANKEEVTNSKIDGVVSPIARDDDVEEDSDYTDKQIAADDATLDASSDDSDDSDDDSDVNVDADLQLSTDETYQKEEDLVDLINLSQSSYKAKLYPEFDGLKLSQMRLMAGGMPYKQVVEEHKQGAAEEGFAPVADLEFGTYDENFDAGLPESWDWRNVDGENYLYEPINQGMCGSCFAVATTDMIQTRLRIQTKNRIKRQLSPQDILNCGQRYAQGCHGGFPYLASKFGQDYGLTSLQCMKYRAEDGSCPRDKSCYENDKIYATKYHYIGGFYGACNPRAMMEEIMNHGPIAIGFQASMSMMHYSSGVFLQMDDVDSTAKNFFEPTNHAVLAIGWGVDHDTGAKYWIAKNSWGPTWGENGYFRIERGKDTAHFESMAVAARAVVPDSL